MRIIQNLGHQNIKADVKTSAFFSGQVAKEKHIGKVASNANVDKWTG